MRFSKAVERGAESGKWDRRGLKRGPSHILRRILEEGLLAKQGSTRERDVDLARGHAASRLSRAQR